MSQHPKPIGSDPSLIGAAPFSVEMVQGHQPPRNRAFIAQPNLGLTILGDVPPPFSIDMTIGSHPDQNRAFPPKNQGWSLSQQTFDPAPFMSSMSAGWYPDQPRIFVERPLGWFTRELDVLFAANEMFVGQHPDSSRQGRLARGESFFPWSGTPAPLSIEMTTGWQSAISRIGPLKNAGWFTTSPVDPFGIEMIIGVMPTSPRLSLIPRIPLPLTDAASNVPAPFSPEMVAGWRLDQARIIPPKNTGWSVLPSVEPFFFEGTFGSHPDTPRLFTGPRPLGWQVTQLTHVPTPLTQEMVYGWQPSTNRVFKSREPSQANTIPIPAFSPDMVIGWHPDTARFFTGPRPLGWQSAQTTHIPAKFSWEMIRGSLPDRSRAWLPPRLGWLPELAIILPPAGILPGDLCDTFYVSADAIFLVSADNVVYVVAADLSAFLVGADPAPFAVPGCQ